MNSEFYISTRTSPVNLGMRLRKCIINDRGIKIGIKETHFGFWKLIKSPKVWLVLASPVIFYSLAMSIYRYPLSAVPESRKIAYLLVVIAIFLIYLVSLYFVWKRNTGTTLKILENEFDNINYPDIQKLTLEKLVTGDNVIVIETNNSKKIKFFVADELNSRNSETQEIFNLISRQRKT